jgi:hypothetical protein
MLRRQIRNALARRCALELHDDGHARSAVSPLSQLMKSCPSSGSNLGCDCVLAILPPRIVTKRTSITIWIVFLTTIRLRVISLGWLALPTSICAIGGAQNSVPPAEKVRTYRLPQDCGMEQSAPRPGPMVTSATVIVITTRLESFD